MEMKEEIKNMKLHGEDLQLFGVFSDHHQAMKDEEEIWFEAVSHHHQQHENNKNDSINNNNNINGDNNVANNNNNGGDILDVVSDPSSLFYADFPTLPDFSCMSSSSSSSSIPAAVAKPFGVSSSATSSSTSTASSGAASWAGLKSDADHDPDPSSSVDMMPPPLSGQNQEGGGGGGVGMVLDDVDHCMDMMQNFGCIDLLESADICWDPSPLFEDNGDDQFLQQSELLENHLGEDNDEDMVFEQFMQEHQHQSVGDVGSNTISDNNNNLNSSGVVDAVLDGQSSGDVGGINQLGSDSSADDLAMVFFEWLKSNKEAISAEDLRNIKIKKSTIENAARRLGGGREGMKQLLKLILQWVQNHHLQNKRAAEDDLEGISASGCGGGGGSGCMKSHNRSYSIEEHTKNNNDNNSNCNNLTPATPSDNISGGNPNCLTEQQCFSPTTWLPTFPPPPPYVNETVGMVHMPVPPHPPPGFPPSVGYNMGGDPYSGSNPMAAYPPPPIPPSDYHSWGPAPMQYGMGPQYGSYGDVAQYGGYGNPPPAYPGYYYHPGPSEGLVRLGSSATKEARKKRMARQRRIFTHHHRSSNHSNNSHQNHNGGGVSQQQMISRMAEQHAVVGNGTCGVAPSGNWVYWPPPPPAAQVVPPSYQVNHSGATVGQMMPPQPPMERPGNGFQKQVGTEKKQGWKTEKNLRFLLQKVLKQSDVGNLGRIVLPKKEAETHLPELEARDGIPIAMEDIGTSRVWNMRYRFWPNNKSRMYLLENTGDFVRSNGLQEGDFIVIYSDVKCGKYMIRGVKVRAQQQGTKPETPNKKPNKTQRLEGCSSPVGTSNMMQS